MNRFRRTIENRYLWIAAGVLAGAIGVADPAMAQEAPVIPAPLSEIRMQGVLRIADGATVSYSEGDPEARFAAEHLTDLLKRTRGLRLMTKGIPAGAPSTAAILLTRTPYKADANPDESYDLTVSPKQVAITASSGAGLYYGTVTLWEMLTAASAGQGTAELHCVRIHDQPQLRWRGLMLDSARHMQSIEFLRQLVEWMSLEKLNVLHWHLTDDQGWRLEIKKYPRLTEIGGWRQLATVPGNGAATRSLRYGGSYSQDEVGSLVAYAAKRNVTIVPEIEMPGHASAAIAAYPELGSSDQHLTAPVNEYGIFPSLYNVNDSTFTFLENVLTEVMELFPSPYIHIGGDEAIKDQWKASPAIQARMQQLGISNEDELQSYFVKRIDRFLTAHHRRTVGWDEILQGGLAENAAVMSWHGVQGGIEAAKQGHDAVLTPVFPLYFNYRQSDAADEAPGRFVLHMLADVYAFDPTPATLTDEQRKHILGIEAPLWTEYVITEDRDAWMLFPRAAALAEVAWSSPQRRNWNDFLQRLVAEMGRERALGIGFDPAAFRVRSEETLKPGTNRVIVRLSNQTNFGTLRYTTDGLEVTASSPRYEQPLDLPLPTHLRAAAFFEDAIPGSELDRQLEDRTVRLRYSQDLKVCSSSPVIAIEPDPPQAIRPVTLVNYENPCWVYKAANLDNITGISVGVLSLPYVFHDWRRPAPALGQPHNAQGDVEVHVDTCDGKEVASLPLGAAAGHSGVTPLHAGIDGVHGIHDLCLKIARPAVNPLWSLDWVQLEPFGKQP